MSKFDADSAITSLNQRLKAAGVSASVVRNGNKLVIRATLPKKPGDGLGRKRYPLSLGIPANRDGIKLVEAKCHELARQVQNGIFDWRHWERDRAVPIDEKPIAQLITEFKEHYQRSHRCSDITWANTWRYTLDKLPPHEPLTEVLILAVIKSTKEDSRIRELTVTRLQHLADYAGLGIDLNPYKGKYGSQSLEPRTIPTDQQILEWRDHIPNESWKWVYGMLSTFGLRDHEIFFCRFVENDPITLEVLKGKTGYRITQAIRPEWVELWDLANVKCPKVSPKDDFRKYGQVVNRAFYRYGMPCHPYDLRHSYAIRASVVERLPLSTAAAFMGHSVEVHTKKYHRWLSYQTNREVYDRVVLKKLPESF
jgi:integrase